MTHYRTPRLTPVTVSSLQEAKAVRKAVKNGTAKLTPPPGECVCCGAV